MSPLPVEKRLKKQGLQKKKSLFLLYSRTKFNVIEDEAYDIQSVTSRLETSRYRDFSQFIESIGLGLENFGLEKSLGIGLENI